MVYGQTPDWLRKAQRHLGWLAVANIAAFLVALQLVGLILIFSDLRWFGRLALLPQRVLDGELWRLVTFLALPLTLSPLWMIFVLWFLYFIVDGIENVWGAFATTFYILVSVLLTICFSLLLGVPITYVGDLESTLVLAAAALNPELRILLFMVIPFKIVWLAWLTGGFVLWRFITGSWVEQLYLVAIYSNYLLFFAPHHFGQLKQWHRRWQFRRQFK